MEAEGERRLEETAGAAAVAGTGAGMDGAVAVGRGTGMAGAVGLVTVGAGTEGDVVGAAGGVLEAVYQVWTPLCPRQAPSFFAAVE